jgi:hypothetical protein
MALGFASVSHAHTIAHTCHPASPPSTGCAATSLDATAAATVTEYAVPALSYDPALVATQTVCKDASATFVVPLTWSAAYDSVSVVASAGATCSMAGSNLTCTVSASGASVGVTATYGGGAAQRQRAGRGLCHTGQLLLQGAGAAGLRRPSLRARLHPLHSLLCVNRTPPLRSPHHSQPTSAPRLPPPSRCPSPLTPRSPSPASPPPATTCAPAPAAT